MPPFTSTSWTTFVRRAVQTARQQIVQKASRKAVRFTKDRFLTLARQSIHETFPSLSQPTFQRLQPRLQPLPIPINPLQAAGRNIRMNRFRHAANMRGADVASRVGLNPSRGFATSTQMGGTPSAHILLRSFAGIDREERRPGLYPKWTSVISYPPKKRRSRLRPRSRYNFPAYIVQRPNNVDIAIVRSIRDTDFWFTPPDFDHYFPTITTAPVATIEGALVPDEVVTENVRTTLSITITPSLDLSSRGDLGQTCKPSEIGVSVFANLFRGLPSLLEAQNSHSSLRVRPLLNRIESLGLLEKTGRTEIDFTMVNHLDQDSSAFQLRFPHRSANDVRRLIGEVSGEGEWYSLDEERMGAVETVGMTNGDLSLAESNPWDTSPSHSGILDGIPDIAEDALSSGFITPIDDMDLISERYPPFDLASSSDDLIFPRMDLSESAIDGTLTPPTQPYDSLRSLDSSSGLPVWSDGSGSIGSIGSVASSTSDWSESLDEVERDLDTWSDGASAVSSAPSSPTSSGSRRYTSQGTGPDSLYGVMLLF